MQIVNCRDFWPGRAREIALSWQSTWTGHFSGGSGEKGSSKAPVLTGDKNSLPLFVFHCCRRACVCVCVFEEKAERLREGTDSGGAGYKHNSLTAHCRALYAPPCRAFNCGTISPLFLRRSHGRHWLVCRHRCCFWITAVGMLRSFPSAETMRECEWASSWSDVAPARYDSHWFSRWAHWRLECTALR